MTGNAWLVFGGATEAVLSAPSDSSTVAVALITTFGSVLVALIGAAALVARRRWTAPNDDEDEEPLPPDQAYRAVLQRLTALTIFLEVRGYKTKKILSGDESDAETR